MIRVFNSKKALAVLMFLSTVALGAVMVQAQVFTVGLKTDIPFRFIVENTTLPAGHYTIVRTTDVEPILDMRNPRKDVNILLVPEATREAMNSRKPELVFDRIGNRDFLREVWTDNSGYVLAKTSQETNNEKTGLKAESHRVPCSHMEKGKMQSMNVRSH